MKPFNEHPIKIQMRMLEEQVTQGNPRSEEVFMKNIRDTKTSGAFDWCDTLEGYDAWAQAIIFDNYEPLYQANPDLRPDDVTTPSQGTGDYISYHTYPLTPDNAFPQNSQPSFGIIPGNISIVKIAQAETVSIHYNLVNEIITELESFYELNKQESTLNILSKLKGTWKSFL